MTAETALIAPNRQARRGQAHPPRSHVARSEGTILPLGASWIEAEQAYNFSIYAQHAESVVLLLFAEDDLARPLLEFRLDPRVNKTWMVWHCRLGGDVGPACYYAYRIDGPRAAGPGPWHAYDSKKVLLDPLAREVFFPPGFDREAARHPGSNLGKAPLGVLPRPGPSPAAVPDRTPRFAKRMIAFRKSHPSLGRARFWRDDVRWYGVGPDVDLSCNSRSVAYGLHGASRGDCDLYVMINAYHEPLVFEIQESPAGGWRRAIDTGLDSPLDIAEPGEEAAVASLRYRVRPRSVVVLVGGDGDEQ